MLPTHVGDDSEVSPVHSLIVQLEPAEEKQGPHRDNNMSVWCRASHMRIFLYRLCPLVAFVVTIMVALHFLLPSAEHEEQGRINPVLKGEEVRPRQGEEVHPRQGGSPVNVAVYYESLCPDSRNFVLNQLQPTFNILPSNIMSTSYIPYGKAETITNHDGTYSFKCQHGPEECRKNRYHACGLVQTGNDQGETVKLVSCLFRNWRVQGRAGDIEAFKSCIEAVPGGNWQTLQDCGDGAQGNQLLANYGQMTHSLQPPVTFIPTILINGVKSDEAFRNLLQAVCNAYTGERPQECGS
ncbi:unnamed protein product [Darwinula stevensoni]|uniref:Gamma-interferon-inducible lysosomal thiol reductase n=1 Tax=Darwinula stevensoni TaxID=69355 RepID=A0A7R8XF57_9CRUS|nr:unnamed protein product [Darwinula stevensoni]CAG0894947.1 unnamed protein product [Darwinula stevensoni]